MNVFIYLWSLNYVRWHMLFSIPPTIILLLFFGKYFWKYKKTIFLISSVGTVWGLLFDLVAGPWWHVWYWPAYGKLGIWYLGMPIEEYGFLVIIPFEITLFLLVFRKYLYKHG